MKRADMVREKSADGGKTERVQLYRFVRRRVFVNKWGKPKPVVDWETECPDCGMTFEVFTRPDFKQPFRRCGECRNRGVKVDAVAVPLWPEGAGETEAPSALGKEGLKQRTYVPGSQGKVPDQPGTTQPIDSPNSLTSLMD